MRREMARLDDTRRLLAETDASLADALERLRHLEAGLRAQAIERARRAEGAAGQAVAATGIPPLDDFDYLAFEDRFRGPEEEVRERQAAHAERLAAAGGPVADLGCGRGELLELLRERGVEAVGVDASAEMVAIAREKGLEAEHGDMFAFLAARPAGVARRHRLLTRAGAPLARRPRALHPALRGRAAPGRRPDRRDAQPQVAGRGRGQLQLRPDPPAPGFPRDASRSCWSGPGSRTSRSPTSRRCPTNGAPCRRPGRPSWPGWSQQLNLAIERLDNLVFGDQEYAVIATRGAA